MLLNTKREMRKDRELANRPLSLSPSVLDPSCSLQLWVTRRGPAYLLKVSLPSPNQL